MIAINAVLSLCIAGLCFYRLLKTTETALIRVRWSFAAMGASSIGMSIAPLAWGLHPGTMTLVLEGAVVLVLAAATPQWKHGPPPETQVCRR